MQCDGEYRGQARTAWQWARSVILLGIAVVCGWGAGNRWAVDDYIASVLLGELATFFTAESQSRGTKLFSSHATITGTFCGFGLLANYASFLWWIPTYWAEGFAVVCAGLASVMAVAEWSNSVHGMLVHV